MSADWDSFWASDIAITPDFAAAIQGWPYPPQGWPRWVLAVPYDGSAIPASSRPIEDGANCQRFAYAVLDLFGVAVPPHRSSELWSDPSFDHPPTDDLKPLDLVLFNARADAFGAHVAVYLAHDRLLHLCREVGYPTVWCWQDFAERERYATLVGAVRAGASGAH